MLNKPNQCRKGELEQAVEETNRKQNARPKYRHIITLDINSLKSESRSVMSDSLRPHGLYSPWNSPGQNTGVGRPFPSPGNLPNPGIEPLLAEPPGKPLMV